MSKKSDVAEAASQSIDAPAPVAEAAASAPVGNGLVKVERKGSLRGWKMIPASEVKPTDKVLTGKR